MALTTLTSRSWASRMTWVPLWVRPMPMWGSLPVHAQGDGSGFVDALVADPVVGLGVAAGPGKGSGYLVVERGGGELGGAGTSDPVAVAKPGAVRLDGRGGAGVVRTAGHARHRGRRRTPWSAARVDARRARPRREPVPAPPRRGDPRGSARPRLTWRVHSPPVGAHGARICLRVRKPVAPLRLNRRETQVIRFNSVARLRA